MRAPGEDRRRHGRCREYGDEGLPVDLPELPDGGEQDGEHEHEGSHRRCECADQLSPGAR